VSARRCRQAKLNRPYPNPSLIDETGLVEACAQTDAVEPLHGAISLSNPFESNAIEVMWAQTDCDSWITFTFLAHANWLQLDR
jgi:hypothetical protein